MSPRRSSRIAAKPLSSLYIPPFESTTTPSVSDADNQPATTTNAASSSATPKGDLEEGRQVLEKIQWLEEHTFKTFEEFLCAGESTNILVRSIIDRALGVEELMDRPFGMSAKEKFVGDYLICTLSDLAGSGNAEALDEANWIIQMHSSTGPIIDENGTETPNWVSSSAAVAAFIAAQSSESLSADQPTVASFPSTKPKRARAPKKASSKAGTPSVSARRVHPSTRASASAANSSTAGKRVRPTATSAATFAASISEPDRGKFPMMRRRHGSAVANKTEEPSS